MGNKISSYFGKKVEPPDDSIDSTLHSSPNLDEEIFEQPSVKSEHKLQKLESTNSTKATDKV